MPTFPKSKSLYMKTDTIRIWTGVTCSISYDDNRYTTAAPLKNTHIMVEKNLKLADVIAWCV